MKVDVVDIVVVMLGAVLLWVEGGGVLVLLLTDSFLMLVFVFLLRVTDEPEGVCRSPVSR